MESAENASGLKPTFNLLAMRGESTAPRFLVVWSGKELAQWILLPPTLWLR